MNLKYTDFTYARIGKSYIIDRILIIGFINIDHIIC